MFQGIAQGSPDYVALRWSILLCDAYGVEVALAGTNKTQTYNIMSQIKMDNRLVLPIAENSKTACIGVANLVVHWEAEEGDLIEAKKA